MLFNSFAFAIFLPIVFALYWLLPHKHRWVLLLIASYYFYMSWNPKYVVLILFTTAASYVAALLMEKYHRKKDKQLILAVTAVLCLGVLFFFKYFNFASTSVAAIMSMFAIQLDPLTLDLLLPVGISFYTFQTLSYVIDVYKGSVKVEHHFGYYATFVSFFPQLVAGPIERTNNLMPQIKAEHHFDYDQATYGLKLMAWGFFKKLVIADILSTYVQTVYNTPHEYHGFALVLASLFFTIQIYCDFSGYSDIAIGTAKLMGVNLMTNFSSPYFSASVREFWKRWHISLSTWFRDYVYIPLGGNRVSKLRHNVNLMITFLVSGLWHGANWTFVFWGFIHGLAQVIENSIFGREKQKCQGALWWIRVVTVFLFCSFAWIFFVSKSITDAFYVVSHMLDGITAPIAYIKLGFKNIAMGKSELGKIAGALVILSIYDYLSLKYDVIEKISNQKVIVRWAVYAILVMMIVFYGASGQAEFVYFQF